MDLDLLCLLGYQLTLVSCKSSDDIRWCKGHGFEAIHRAQQLGGEEAKAVLLTLMSEQDVRQLSEDLAEEYGTDAAPLVILGREAFADLDGRLATVLNR